MKINNQEKTLIEDAIKKAELNTSGEIVPVILDQSDFYPAAHFRLSLLCGIFSSLICYYTYDFDDPIMLIWSQIPGMVIGYLLAFIPFLKRLLISKVEMQEEVYQRALQVFYENQVSMTKDRTGIMIFLSLLERRVEILADCGINEKVEKNYWDNLVSSLILKIKKGNAIDGVVSAIDTCGKSLMHFFPIQSDDTNEVSNKLITD